MRILLVEDNEELADWLGRLLRKDNYVVDHVADGETADAVLKTEDYALVLLDLALPGIGGLEVLKRLRARKQAVPVIVLTANDALSSRIGGLDSGADDYVVKPFDPSELAARVRAHLRRTSADRKLAVSFGGLTLDTASRVFELDGAALALTPREHALLEALILRSGRPVPKESLVSAVFGLDDEAGPNAIEVHVHRLRKKLEGSGLAVVTVRGLGYVLRAEHG